MMFRCLTLLFMLAAPPALAAPIPYEPIQLATKRSPWVHGDYHMTALADFAVDARVLAKERYRLDRGAELAPYDFALGWQEMSDPGILSQISFSQAGRRFVWHTKGNYWPIPRDRIEHGAANMHLIPASPSVRKIFDTIKPGNRIRVIGSLVHVKGSDGWLWRSSLSRSDTGDGACEVMWVDEVTIVP